MTDLDQPTRNLVHRRFKSAKPGGNGFNADYRDSHFLKPPRVTVNGFTSGDNIGIVQYCVKAGWPNVDGLDGHWIFQVRLGGLSERRRFELPQNGSRSPAYRYESR